MKYLSLFSGMEGFGKGLEQAYENYAHEQIGQPIGQGFGGCSAFGRKSQLPSCIGFAEIERNAVAVNRFHYPDRKNYGDASRIVCDELPDFDFLCAGFPCQSFSVAGKRRGFDEAGGTLFFEIARILSHKRPRHFLLENVKGLLSSDDGQTYPEILRVLSRLDYRLETVVLNSKYFGVPQNRERVFFIGHSGSECSGEILSFREGDERYFKTLRTGSVIRGRNKNTSGCLDTRGVNAFDRADLDKLIFLKNKIRRLTPVETERLQGFPDDFSKYGINEKGQTYELSDSARYKLCGNAVTTNVVAAIITKMLETKCLS